MTMQTKVRIIRSEEAQGAQTGWIVWGPHPDRWLRELTRGEVALDTIRVGLIPSPSPTPEPMGLFIPDPLPGLPASPHVQALRCIGQSFYLPQFAETVPAFTDAEADQAVHHNLGLFHPACGLVLFGEEDLWTVDQLVAAPSIRRTRWHLGAQGVELNDMIHAIEVAAVPEMDIFLDDGKGDIASQELDDLPPIDGEPKDGTLHRGLDAMRRGVARGVLGLTNLAPEGAIEPTWTDQVESWAMKKIKCIDRIDHIARNKELHRLLNMLKHNPEEGLKHAIPLGGIGRGKAPPSNRLGSRNTNFNLSQLGGGGAVDAWDLDAEYQETLRKQYTDLAEREARLGNYRRAAYIYAVLLVDVHSAAEVLERGGHYREAADIFQKKFNDKKRAAECLERGGLLHEAIALYAEMQEHETCGNLHQQLDETKAAETCYRMAITQHEKKEQHADVFRLLDKKLGQSEEALEVIDRAWPDSKQRVDCMNRHFQLLAKLGRHSDSEQLIRQLARDPASLETSLALVEVLQHLLAHYPDAGIKSLTADAGKVHIGLQLCSENGAQMRRLAISAPKFNPDDRLLPRDSRRFR